MRLLSLLVQYSSLLRVSNSKFFVRSTSQATNGIYAALIAFALIGKYAGIYGRRYSLLVIGFIPVLSTAAIIIGVTVHNTILKVVFLALYTLLGSFAGPKGITLLGSLFVLDTTDGPADR